MNSVDLFTADFIRAHRNDDVRRLALQVAGRSDIDVPFVLDQIAGWQKARTKLPSWAATDGIVYPPHLSMEQCSGEPAARFKADVAGQLCRGVADGGAGLMADLTGGLGVDFSFMARRFGRSVYVERDERLCRVARHNFGVLALGGAEVVCGDGAEYLRTMEHADLIYIDPARRDACGGRTYAIKDCTPDVLGMERGMLARASWVMIKLSPMLDWHEAVASMEAVCPGAVRHVYIVSMHGECKELLVVLSEKCATPLRIHCVNGVETMSFGLDDLSAEERLADVPYTELAGMRLYEPDASVMKAGCFGLLCRRYGVRAVGRSSRLFVSSEDTDGFPGRRFRVSAVSSMNRKELKRTLGGLDKANIAVRNFPLSVADLRRRLRIGEGGDVYIFATTAADGTHILAVCRK